MSIKLRFGLTLGLLLLGLGATLGWVRRLEQKEQHRIQAEIRSEHQDLLDYWLKTDATTFIRAARDLARDQQVVARLKADRSGPVAPEPAEGGHPQDFTIWLLRADGTLLLRRGPHHLAGDILPLGQADFTQQVLQPAGCHFFTVVATTLVEVCAEPVALSSDRSPVGWLLLLRPWDQKVLDAIGTLAGSRLQLILQGSPTPSPMPLQHFQYRLPGWNQQPVANLVADFPATVTALPATGLASPLPWFVLFGVLVIAAVSLGLQRWVLHPLDRIGASLVADEPAPLLPLRQTQGELGRVARLVESFFVQRDALKQSEASLQQALDERIRLGRDLHDGVIQSLYATGMGLAGLKAQLQPEQTHLANGLDQCRQALNETIHDLRNFITGLEPEALKEQTFGEAVALLLDNARHTRAVATVCEIDEDLATRLTISQRANILQITREAISNALRHGEATEIAIRLKARGEQAEFEISDNGHGFDPIVENGNGGHGLENLAGRARDIGAQFTLQSHPGAGTRLLLSFIPRPTDNP